MYGYESEQHPELTIQNSLAKVKRSIWKLPRLARYRIVHSLSTNISVLIKKKDDQVYSQRVESQYVGNHSSFFCLINL